jgi:hypothetical protein
MSNPSDRRKFIKNLGVGGLTAGIIPTALFGSTATNENRITDEKC